MESAATGPAPAGPQSRRSETLINRHPALAVYLPFLALSLIVVLLLNHDYQRGRTQNAIRDYETAGEWEKAVPLLEKLVTLAPQQEIDWRQEMGTDYLRAGKYDKAMVQFETAKKMNPSVNLAKPRMICAFETGLDEEGRGFRDKVLATSPKDAAANYYLAKELLAQGKLVEAGKRLRLTVTETEWNEKSEPLRKELAEKMFGKPAAAK